jgi:hypothetical protein
MVLEKLTVTYQKNGIITQKTTIFNLMVRKEMSSTDSDEGKNIS